MAKLGSLNWSHLQATFLCNSPSSSNVTEAQLRSQHQHQSFVFSGLRLQMFIYLKSQFGVELIEIIPTLGAFPVTGLAAAPEGRLCWRIRCIPVTGRLPPVRSGVWPCPRDLARSNVAVMRCCPGGRSSSRAL